MPGLTPFLDALRLPPYFCTNCGFWQRYFEVPPSCPLCLDARHVVPGGGWRFLDVDQATGAYPCHFEELETGVWRFWNDPVDGIGANAYLVVGQGGDASGHRRSGTGQGGNFMFEGAAIFDNAALNHIDSLGGIAVLSASHPHSYGALWQLQDRYEPELALHPGDLAWSSALRVTWPFDDHVEVLPGISLHHTGGHFDGHAVAMIHGPKILMCGDALKFELDPGDPRKATTISSHKAFVRGVPGTPAELRRYRAVFSELDFEQTWTPFEQAANSGRDEAVALIDSQLATRPHPRQVPLEELRQR